VLKIATFAKPQTVIGHCKMTARHNKILVLILTINLSTAFGQTKDEKIKSIREKFQKINQDTSYRTKTLENEEFLDHMTDGGGDLTGYLKDKKIFKIFERVGVSYCVRTFEYYFWDEKLIFIYEKELDFKMNDSTGFDYEKQTLAFEGRYYFDNGKLIETKTTGAKAIEYDKDENKEKILLADAKRNADLLKK
jgi:hypothetical protein